MLVLSYHELAKDESSYRYSIPEARFASHVRLSTQHPGVRFTFDDGHISQFDLAAPILQNHGLTGTFFVTVGWIGLPHMVDWPQLAELVKSGHEVQAHGWHHKFMTECTPSELDQELRQARECLEDRLGTAVDALALPHGRYNARVLDRCAESGYKRVYGSYPWFGNRIRARYPGLQLIGRSNIPLRTSDDTFARMLRSGADHQRVAMLRGAISVALRKAIGDSTYHRLWLRFAHRSAADLPLFPEEEPRKELLR